MDMEQFTPTPEEFAAVMQQLYPEQSARVSAELRAAKMQQYIASQQQDGSPNRRPVKKATKRTKTATTRKASK